MMANRGSSVAHSDGALSWGEAPWLMEGTTEELRMALHVLEARVAALETDAAKRRALDEDVEQLEMQTGNATGSVHGADGGSAEVGSVIPGNIRSPALVPPDSVAAGGPAEPARRGVAAALPEALFEDERGPRVARPRMRVGFGEGGVQLHGSGGDRGLLTEEAWAGGARAVEAPGAVARGVETPGAVAREALLGMGGAVRAERGAAAGVIGIVGSDTGSGSGGDRPTGTCAGMFGQVPVRVPDEFVDALPGALQQMTSDEANWANRMIFIRGIGRGPRCTLLREQFRRRNTRIVAGISVSIGILGTIFIWDEGRNCWVRAFGRSEGVDQFVREPNADEKAEGLVFRRFYFR